jgi:hypothetical protein
MPKDSTKNATKFVTNAEDVAKSALAAINPALTDKFVTIIRFMVQHPSDAATKGNKKAEVGSEAYIRSQATNFTNGRLPQSPKAPTTVPDELVSYILHNYFNVPASELERAKEQHLLSMAAENMVGTLLEHYLATILEPRGWIWCSGSILRATDFIKPLNKQGDSWTILQVKNRDNSENSSSSAIRVGTTIEKWFRTYSRKNETNWNNFPDEAARAHLSEAVSSREQCK